MPENESVHKMCTNRPPATRFDGYDEVGFGPLLVDFIFILFPRRGDGGEVELMRSCWPPKNNELLLSGRALNLHRN